MIKERYCSFEVAKLLKEKGFNEDCRDSYDWGGNFHLNTSANNGSIKKIAAPTQSMAIDWLREVYHLHITVFSSSQESWMYRVTKPHQTLEEGCYGEDYTSYEEACEAAIKYCLENLI